MLQSYGAWQVVLALTSSLGARAKQVTFRKYAESLNLVDRTETKSEVKNRVQSEKQSALAAAKRVQAAFMKRKGRAS